MSMLAEQRKKAKWALNPMRKPLWTTDPDTVKFGKKLMEKMGWSAGKGLGANEQGMQEPLRVAYKNDSKGMGFKENENNWLEHQDEFNSLLDQLRNTDDSSIVKLSDSNEIKSLEEKSKQLKARLHYKKFTRGKDLSTYSENDLACILGTKKIKKKNKTNKTDEGNDFENSFGVVTKNSGSLVDYFNKKLLTNSTPTENFEEMHETLLEEESGKKRKHSSSLSEPEEVPEKKKKHKEHKKNKNPDKDEKINDDDENIVEAEVEYQVKKKKKRKRVDEEPVEDVSDKKSKKKKKRKKEKFSESINDDEHIQQVDGAMDSDEGELKKKKKKKKEIVIEKNYEDEGFVKRKKKKSKRDKKDLEKTDVCDEEQTVDEVKESKKKKKTSKNLENNDVEILIEEKESRKKNKKDLENGLETHEKKSKKNKHKKDQSEEAECCEITYEKICNPKEGGLNEKPKKRKKSKTEVECIEPKHKKKKKKMNKSDEDPDCIIVDESSIENDTEEPSKKKRKRNDSTHLSEGDCSKEKKHISKKRKSNEDEELNVAEEEKSKKNKKLEQTIIEDVEESNKECVIENEENPNTQEVEVTKMDEAKVGGCNEGSLLGAFNPVSSILGAFNPISTLLETCNTIISLLEPYKAIASLLGQPNLGPPNLGPYNMRPPHMQPPNFAPYNIRPHNIGPHMRPPYIRPPYVRPPYVGPNQVRQPIRPPDATGTNLNINRTEINQRPEATGVVDSPKVQTYKKQSSNATKDESKNELLEEKKLLNYSPGSIMNPRVLAVAHWVDISEFKGSNLPNVPGYGNGVFNRRRPKTAV